MGQLLAFLFGAMAISFLCSVLEAVLMSTPISYITLREEEGYKPAVKMKSYKQDSSRPIAAILSLNTIANTIGAAGVGRQATIVFGSEWFGLVSAITTVLILVFSEIVPKTIGTTCWRQLMGFTTSVIRCLIVIMFPCVWLIEKLQRLITPKSAEAAISRDEVSAMANVAEEAGDLEEDENEIIQNVINMDEIVASDVMTPRVVAAIAPESMSVKAFFRDKRYRNHSRIPVFADNDEYITGYILRMDALQLVAEDKFDTTLGNIKRPVASFSQDTTLDVIWDEMLTKDEQISIVIDEYGSFQGILSLEDVIETIVGSEIVDERDSVRDMQQLALSQWKKRSDQAGK
ncbi:MAG: CNNM domain-containing protein [Candidatus Cryptobacteroides sp.]